MSDASDMWLDRVVEKYDAETAAAVGVCVLTGVLRVKNIEALTGPEALDNQYITHFPIDGEEWEITVKRKQ